MSLKVTLGAWPYVSVMAYSAPEDEKPLPMRGSFDFSPVLDALYPLIEEMKGPNVAPLINPIMPVRHLRAYMAHYFGSHFYPNMERIWNDPENKAPSWLYLNDRYDEGYKSKHRIESKPRSSDRYLLTEQETKEAREVYKKSPMLQMVVASIQSGILHYLADMYVYHKESYGIKYAGTRAKANVGWALQEAQSFAGAFSMMHDLMPVIALSMSREGWTPSQAMTGEGFSRGLASAFQRSAFSTWDKAEGSSVLTETRCPFTKIAGHLFNTVLETDAGGVPHVVEGAEQAGALPVFVAGRLEAHYGRNPHRIPSLIEALTINRFDLGSR